MRRWIERIVVGGALFFMTGCSEPPVKEHDQAVSAIAAARTAGAPDYAADEFTAAEASLKRYDEFVTQRDYKQALGAAIDSRDRAFESAKTAATRQQVLRVEATQLLSALDAALVATDAQLKTARPRTMAKAVDKLRQTRKAATTAMQEARTHVESGLLLKAVQRLTDATAAVKRDSAALEEAARKPKK